MERKFKFQIGDLVRGSSKLRWWGWTHITDDGHRHGWVRLNGASTRNLLIHHDVGMVVGTYLYRGTPNYKVRFLKAGFDVILEGTDLKWIRT